METLVLGTPVTEPDLNPRLHLRTHRDPHPRERREEEVVDLGLFVSLPS